MSVSVLLITHGTIGATMIRAMTTTFGELPLDTATVAVDYKSDPSLLLPNLEDTLKKLDRGEGVLILTDIYGSTPCNIAQKLQKYPGIEVVTGLNLPMLIRVMNYPNLDVTALAEKALTAGKEGVVNCRKSSGNKHD